MNFVEVTILFFIALFIAALFSYGFRTRSPWGGFWVFLFLLFLGAWAARYWLVPAGPLMFGFAWIPVFFFVLFFAVLIAALSGNDTATRNKLTAQERATGPEGDKTGAVFAFGIFFWFLIIILLVAIAAGFLLVL